MSGHTTNHNCERLRVGCKKTAGPGHSFCTRCECVIPDCVNAKGYPKPFVRFQTQRAMGPYIFGWQYSHCSAHFTAWEAQNYKESVERLENMGMRRAVTGGKKR
jgi:hypothetical protein